MTERCNGRNTYNSLKDKREAVQGSNETYDVMDRRALRAEIVDLQAEIDRISDDTTWNGLNVI